MCFEVGLDEGWLGAHVVVEEDEGSCFCFWDKSVSDGGLAGVGRGFDYEVFAWSCPELSDGWAGFLAIDTYEDLDVFCWDGLLA